MKNGIIVPKNNPQALAEAIDLLIENKELREKLGLAALKIRNRFDQNKIVKAFTDAIGLYEC
jgi:glycosyltransferase involved in cell wall biosynthesis